MDEITIPDVPQEIIDAINNDNLAVFVGAGVSAIAGLPLWSQLAKDLICECYSKGLYSYKDKELILERIQDNKQLITIAFGKLKEAGLESIFYRILKKHLKLNKSKIRNAGTRIFSWLRDTNSLVLTTNADELLHDYFESSLIYEVVPDLKEDQTSLQRGRLVHLHGVISRKDTLVFTTKQYLKRYREECFQGYLNTIFTNKTVLFIGYGMSEFELLDILIQKSSSSIQHFILAPYFSYAEPVASAMKEYYSELGIKQIEYFIDVKGYPYLADILDSWLPKIWSRTNLSSRILQSIREILNQDPSNIATKDKALQLIKTNRMLEKEFFEKLIANKQYCVDWLIALETSECFDPKFRNYPPKTSNEGDGRTYYSAVPWFGFRTLLEITQTVPENMLLRDILTRVVRATILDTLNNPEKAGNWAIGRTVAKSIVLLSPDEIGDSVWNYITQVSNFPIAANQNIFTMEFSHNLERILSWSPQQILRVIEMYFEYQSKPGSESEFWLERITEKWLTSIVTLIPNPIVTICIKIIQQRYNEDAFRLWGVGAFSKYPDENGIMINGSHDYYASLIIWLRAAIKELSADSAIELVSTYMQSACPVLRRMAIFTISHFYSICDQLLFKARENNLFDDREILSDLFDLIKLNLPKMNHDQIHTIYNWILKSNFGIEEGGNLQIQVFRRAILLSVLKDSGNEYFDDYIKYSSMVHREIQESDAYNISKRIYTDSSDFDQRDSEVFSVLETKNPSEWQELLEEIATNATQYTIWVWDDAIRKKIGNEPEIVINNLTSFILFPDAFLPTLIRQLDNYDYNDIELSTMILHFLLDVIKRKSGDAASSAVIIEALSVIQQHYLDRAYSPLLEEIAYELNSWVSNYVFDNEPWNQREDPVFILHNKPYPASITTLVSVLSKIYDSNHESTIVKTCLLNFHNRLVKNIDDWVIRCVLGSQIEGLAYLNRTWAEEHLPLILSEGKTNLAVLVTICHTARLIFFMEWYPYFGNSSLFISIFSTTADEVTDYINRAKSIISGIATYAFLKGLDYFGKPCSLLDAVVQQNNANMLLAGFSLFEQLLAQEAPPTEPNREVLELKFECYLVEVMKYFSEFEHLHLRSLVKCVQYIQSPSLALWKILIDLAIKCPVYYINEEWLDLMQKHFDNKVDEVSDLLYSLIRNPKFSHLQEDEKAVVLSLLQKLHKIGEDEKARTIRYLLLEKGYSEFAEDC